MMLEAGYTTQDLVEIAERERAACLRGDRLSLQPIAPTGNPAIDYFLDGEGIQRYRSFQNFQSTLHHYQQEHQVSGLVEQREEFQGQILVYPTIAPYLIALPTDQAALREAYPRVIQFWQGAIADLELYYAWPPGKTYHPLSVAGLAAPGASDLLEQLISSGEWATVLIWDNRERSNFLEIILQLYRFNSEGLLPFPQAQECVALHGVLPGQFPLG